MRVQATRIGKARQGRVIVLETPDELLAAQRTLDAKGGGPKLIHNQLGPFKTEGKALAWVTTIASYGRQLLNNPR